MFLLVQPYADGPERFHRATVVGEYETAAEAFAALDRMGERPNGFGIRGDAIEIYVVDEERRTVKRADAN
jgi:hypothetical protein